MCGVLCTPQLYPGKELYCEYGYCIALKLSVECILIREGFEDFHQSYNWSLQTRLGLEKICRQDCRYVLREFLYSSGGLRALCIWIHTGVHASWLDLCDSPS